MYVLPFSTSCRIAWRWLNVPRPESWPEIRTECPHANVAIVASPRSPNQSAASDSHLSRCSSTRLSLGLMLNGAPRLVAEAT
jgi:hypothetical protein